MAIGLFSIVALLVAFTASDDWQPPRHDATISGVGTNDDPLSVTKPVTYDNYSIVLTQATTAAPTALTLANTIDTTAAPVWSRDSIGTYVVTRTDAWPDSTILIQATLGLSAPAHISAYRQSDSTLVVRCETITGVGVDLAGKAYITVQRYPD